MPQYYTSDKKKQQNILSNLDGVIKYLDECHKRFETNKKVKCYLIDVIFRFSSHKIIVYIFFFVFSIQEFQKSLNQI